MRRLTGVLVVIVLVTCLAAVGSAQTGGAAPAGQMIWAVHFTLAPRWLDPAETEGSITPFLTLYAVHDALLKPMPSGPSAASLAESWTVSPERPRLRLHAPGQRALPQRRAGDRGGREVLLRALPRGQRDHLQGARPGSPRARRPTPAVSPEGAVAGLHHLLRHHREQRGLGRAEEVHRAGGRGWLQEGPDRRGALQGGQLHARRRAPARGLRRLLAQGPRP